MLISGLGVKVGFLMGKLECGIKVKHWATVRLRESWSLPGCISIKKVRTKLRERKAGLEYISRHGHTWTQVAENKSSGYPNRLEWRKE